MTWTQTYLSGLAFVAMLFCVCADPDQMTKRPFAFSAAVFAIVLWPLLPVFVLIGKKLNAKVGK
jgi:hypothetical protein